MLQTYTIMVVDDDETQQKLLRKLLTREQYSVYSVDSGKQAIMDIQNGFLPDLILLDITMPDMNGYETFKRIKEIHNIPTIFLTAVEDTQAEVMGFELGAVDYITKPFVCDILLARIKNRLCNLSLYQQEQAAASELAVQFDTDKLNQMKCLLTESEYKVSKLIALGYTNQEIADYFNYSYSYVKKIAYNIFEKLQINKRNEIRPFFFNEP